MRRSALVFIIVIAIGAAPTGGRAGSDEQSAASAQAGGAAQAPPNPFVAPSEAGASTISGVAVDGTTNQPLAGVVVYLGPPQHGPPGAPIRQLTDGKGRFVFTRLPAYDGYFINATKFGYREGHYGRPSSGQLGARITVGEGEWVQDIRVVMNRPATISGIVTDDHNEPLVGAYVRVLRQVIVSGEPQIAAGHVATTDDRGMYRIVNLVPGKYYVQMPSVQNAFPASTPTATLAGMAPQSVASAQAAGRPIAFADPVVDVDATTQLVIGRYPIPPRSADGKRRVYPSTFFPAASTIAGATLITVSPGEERTGIDLRVAPVAAWRVSGRIDAPTDATAGMTVRLALPGTEDLGEGSEVATALVGPDGRFHFIDVPSGAYLVDARDTVAEYQSSGALGAITALPRTPANPTSGSGTFGVFSGTEGTRMSYRNRAGAGWWGRQAVNVDGRDVADLVVAMNKGGTISGRYVFEGARPQIPLGVTAQPARGHARLGIVRSRDNASGPDTFLIEGLMPGEYVLRPPSRAKSIICGGQDYTYRPIDMSAARDLSDCVVTLTDKTIVVTGTARDDRGRGLSEIGIIVFPVEREQWTAFGFSPDRIKSVQATNSGFFRFQSLPAGEYLFIAVPAEQVNAWAEPGYLAVAAALATRVRLSWGDVVAQDLTVKTVRWSR